MRKVFRTEARACRGDPELSEDEDVEEEVEWKILRLGSEVGSRGGKEEGAVRGLRKTKKEGARCRTVRPDGQL